MTKREAKRRVALGVHALMGAAGENAWLFEDGEGNPLPSKDAERMCREFDRLSVEIGSRGAALLKERA